MKVSNVMRMDVYIKEKNIFLQKLEVSHWMMDARKYKECGFCRIYKLQYKTNHYINILDN